MKTKRHESFICVAVISLFTLIFGCAGSPLITDYGMIIPDQDVMAAFERYDLNPNYNYYISGSDLYPDALIGLDKNYTLESDLWKKMDFTPQTYRILVMDMQDKARQLNTLQHGFAILDNKGHPIGVWYSLLSVRTWVKMSGERSVIIVTPELGVYDQKEKGKSGMPSSTRH